MSDHATPAVLPSIGTQVPLRLGQHVGLGSLPLQGALAAPIGLLSLGSGLQLLWVAAQLAQGHRVAEAHAPAWVLFGAGLLFTPLGAWLLAEGVGQLARTIARARRQRRFPDQAWLADFAWERHGGRDRAHARVLRAIGLAAMLAAFAASVAWAGLASGAGIPVRLLGVLLLVAAIRVGGRALGLAWRTLRWGRSRLRFADFPCAPGGDVEVIFDDLARGARALPLRATLRCVQQRWEVTRSPRPHSEDTTQLVDYVLWRALATVPPGARSTRFTLPPDAPSTDLTSRPARYWELEVVAAVPGVEYRACFLVPVYG